MQQIQRLSHTFPLTTPTKFNPSPSSSPSSSRFRSNFPPNSDHKLILTHNSTSGFCNSLKRVSKPGTRWRNYRHLVKCGEAGDGDDGFYMRRCVELARLAIGCTSPNPMVGCVIVKDSEIIGEGFHPKAGQPHAEVYALRDAGISAENATAYVSLEPCNHFGRTPPCTEALIKAKVKKVVVGMVDPNPIVSSKGLHRLREAGITVVSGVEEELCKSLNEAFIHQMLTGKPFVALRYSLSVNGHFLNELGEGAAEAGGYYSQLLQQYDAVVLSSSLASGLSVPASQEPGANQPLRVILASDCSFPVNLSGLTEETASRTIIFTDKEMVVGPETAQKGIETVNLDQMNLNVILDYCKRRGCCSVLLDLRGSFDEFEGILQEGIQQDLLQKVVVEMLPMWDEKSDGGNAFMLLNSLGKSVNVKNLQPKISNRSAVLEGYISDQSGIA